MYEIADKVFFVTGAASGIGAIVVRLFLEEGAKHVAILDLDVASGKALEEELASKHGQGKVKFYKCDVTTNDLTEAYDNVLKEFQYIDVVVNNAGLMNDSPTVYEKMIAVNVTALITSSLKAYDLMRKDHGGKGGTIVNISSIIALFPGRLLPIYAATKSAVLQFSNGLGNEPHFSRSGVRTVTMCFGCTETSLFSREKMAAIDKETDKNAFDMLSMFPWQKPEDAARGLVEAYKRGASGSTWLVTSGRPAEDITSNIDGSFQILGKGVFDNK